MEHILHTCSRQ